VIELEFHQDLYSGFAVDSAVKVYADFATCELERKDDRFVVRLTAKEGQDEAAVAAELANYALGATIEERRPALA
jgi:hypothetical protein